MQMKFREARRTAPGSMSKMAEVRSNRSALTAQALLIASSWAAIWKLTRLEGFGNRFKVQDLQTATRSEELK